MINILSIILVGIYIFYLFRLTKKFKGELKPESDNNIPENVNKKNNIRLKLMAYNVVGLVVLFFCFFCLIFIKKTFNL